MLYSNPFWREFFWSSIAAWIVLETWVYIRDRRAVSGQKQDRGSIYGVIFSIWLAIWLLFYLPMKLRFSQLYPPSPFLFASGLVLIWAGLALRLWSILTLGRFFRTSVLLQDDHALVTAGPYRLLRHPSYAGTLLTIAGIGIARQNWLCALLAFAVVSAGFGFRIRVEEKALGERFGPAFAAQRERSWLLIPFLW